MPSDKTIWSINDLIEARRIADCQRFNNSTLMTNNNIRVKVLSRIFTLFFFCNCYLLLMKQMKHSQNKLNCCNCCCLSFNLCVSIRNNKMIAVQYCYSACAGLFWMKRDGKPDLMKTIREENRKFSNQFNLSIVL